MAIRQISLLTIIIIFFFFFHPTPSLAGTPYFSVVDFGAKSDGKTDATGHFEDAWDKACGSTEPAIMYVPDGRFLVKSIVFKGPCRSSGVGFRIDGTIVAPSGYTTLDSDGTWIAFEYVGGLTIYGGILDGQGQAMWACKDAGRSCPSGAKSLSIGQCNNTKISGITSINSELFHIFIYESQFVTVQGTKLVAPGDSPNTDGIHVQDSTGITLIGNTIMTGDDCISIGPGTSNVWIERTTCGPGHGISIGSLGQQPDEAGVQNVTVKTATMVGTMNGLRIKTWAKPSDGFVKDVMFQHVSMKNVQNPIIIDQNYCPHYSGCPKQTSGIAISKVVYDDVKGTSATKTAVDFNCSPSHPCSGIQLQDVSLTYQNTVATASCSHSGGSASGVIAPPSCL